MLVLNFQKHFDKLSQYLSINPKDKISKPFNISICSPISNISELVILEKPLTKDLINESLILAEKTMKNISVNNLFFPIMFNQNKKILEMDYFGRFSPHELMVEISKFENEFKESSLTHELFHALDYHLFSHFKQKPGFKNIETDETYFTAFVSSLEIYHEMLEGFNISLDKIKNDQDFGNIYNFYKNFDIIDNKHKLSTHEIEKYIKNYLNIDINDCSSVHELRLNILTLHRNQRKELMNLGMKTPPNFSIVIGRLSEEVWNYYKINNNLDSNQKSLYAIMSELVPAIACETTNYRNSLSEKNARIFEMNARSKNDNVVYKTLSKDFFNKNIYPVGSEREFYTQELNNQLHKLSKLINIPSIKFTQLSQLTLLPIKSKNSFDLANINKENITSKISQIRGTNYQINNDNKLKI